MTQERPGLPELSESDCIDMDSCGSVFENYQKAFDKGADEQLRLCVKWLLDNEHLKAGLALHRAMWPDPPSLKQQALRDLDGMVDAMRITWGFEPAYPTAIRQAIESLPD